MKWIVNHPRSAIIRGGNPFAPLVVDFHLLDTGRFALEDGIDKIADLMLALLDKHAQK
jgi:hypothetical protein